MTKVEMGSCVIPSEDRVSLHISLQNFEEGRKEVIEWIEKNKTITYGRPPLKRKWVSINPIEWQVQLKKWGG